jgi:hypothetical protein
MTIHRYTLVRFAAGRLESLDYIGTLRNVPDGWSLHKRSAAKRQ